MSFAYFSPSWFFGYDILFEGIFALITLAVSFLAYKIYKKTSEKQVRLVSFGFLAIAISYVFQSIFNALMIGEMRESVNPLIKMKNMLFFQTAGIYLQMFFMMLGLAILLYMSFRTPKQRVFWFILTVMLFPLLIIGNALQVFFLFSTIALGFILWYFIDNYREHRQGKTLLVTLAFLFLFIGKAHYLIGVDHHLFYVLGHILEMIAYLLILTNLLLVLKK